MIPRLCPPISLASLPKLVAQTVSVERFETAFAQLAGTKHAIAFPYGRTALICLLEAMGIHNKEVICPSYTCVVVPHAITYSGNRPVFVDCVTDSFLMDLALAQEAVQADTGVIIPTSFFGEPVSVAGLEAFRAANPQIKIIQDCAHSFFCTDDGKPVHRYGDAAIYGLNVSKLITSVFGGMVTTDDDALAVQLRQVRATNVKPATLAKSLSRRLYLIAARLALARPIFGAIHAIMQWGVLDRFVRYYDQCSIDMPADYMDGMSGFEAAVGLQQCGQYHAVVAHRRLLAAQYSDGLRDHAEFTLPQHHVGHTWSHYVVRTAQAQQHITRMRAHGVELGELLDYFIPDMPAYQAARHMDRGIAKQYIGNVINLPVHAFVRPDDATRIIAAIKMEQQT